VAATVEEGTGQSWTLPSCWGARYRCGCPGGWRRFESNGRTCAEAGKEEKEGEEGERKVASAPHDGRCARIRSAARGFNNVYYKKIGRVTTR
jgi:hypothetical protein